MSAGRVPRPLSPEGKEALDEAVAATDLVRDARQAVTWHAERRRSAVLRANQHGVSYRRIALVLGVSLGNVQQLVNAARKDAGARKEAS